MEREESLAVPCFALELLRFLTSPVDSNHLRYCSSASGCLYFRSCIFEVTSR